MVSRTDIISKLTVSVHFAFYVKSVFSWMTVTVLLSIDKTIMLLPFSDACVIPPPTLNRASKGLVQSMWTTAINPSPYLVFTEKPDDLVTCTISRNIPSY